MKFGRVPNPSSRGQSCSLKGTEVKVARSCPTLWDLHGLYSSWNSLGQNTGLGSCSLLQGIFPAQGSNPGLPHCRRIATPGSLSPTTLEWVAYPLAGGWIFPTQVDIPDAGNAGVSCIAGTFFTNWAIREAPQFLNGRYKLLLFYQIIW